MASRKPSHWPPKPRAIVAPESDPDQVIIPYSANLNGRIAEIRALQRVLEHDGWAPARAQGVIDLLERIAINSTDGESTHARKSVLAARIASKNAVSERTIVRWRKDAEQLGVLLVVERSHKFGKHYTNFYRILRSRLLELISGRGDVRCHEVTRGDTVSSPGGDTVSSPGGDTVSSPQVIRKELDRNRSGPVAAGAGREDFQEEAKGSHADSARNTPAGEPPDMDRLRSELMEDHPLLRDAQDRRVAPLPPGALIGNAYAVLDERGDEVLSNGRIIWWFRQQAGLRRPVMCDTEADLLLALATGLAAAEIPTHKVKKSRRRAFAFMVSRRSWQRVTHKLGRARELLDKMLVEFPEALSHPESLGQRIGAPLHQEIPL